MHLLHSAVRATPFIKMAVWSLRERTVFGADNRYMGMGINVVNRRIVIAVAVHRFGFFDKFLCC